MNPRLTFGAAGPHARCVQVLGWPSPPAGAASGCPPPTRQVPAGPPKPRRASPGLREGAGPGAVPLAQAAPAPRALPAGAAARAGGGGDWAGPRAAGAVAGGRGGGGASPEACARADRPADGPARRGRGPRGGEHRGARATRARAAAGGAGPRGGARRGGGGPGAGCARGRPQTLLRPVGRPASLSRQRKAQPRRPSPSVSFLPTQRKTHTREGKTIAGPPGTRRAGLPPGGGGRGGTGSGGPTSEPQTELRPRRVGLPVAPGSSPRAGNSQE